MKKSRVVTLGLLASVAGSALGGCGGAPAPEVPNVPPNTQLQQCVDTAGRVVPDEDCDKQGPGANYANGGVYHPMPFWIYHMGRPFAVGQVVPNAYSLGAPLPSYNAMRASALANDRQGAGTSWWGRGSGGGSGLRGESATGGSSSSGISRGGFGGIGGGESVGA